MELVRHRLCAFSQESTRYVDYNENGKIGHCQFIIPPWSLLPPGTYLEEIGVGSWRKAEDSLILPVLDAPSNIWLRAMNEAEDSYNSLRKQNWSPQQARSVLPNSTKTEIVTTTNFREWRHIFRMRTSNHAHPQIREVMVPLLKEFQLHLPELFEDIEIK